MNQENVVAFPLDPEGIDDSNKRSYAKRWKHEALVRQYLVVPSFFLRCYANLKPYPLTLPEAMLVIQLMDFKWDSKDPFPSCKLLAQRMGVGDKRVRRLAQSLEGKGYLRRKMRMSTTNQYDLNPLFDALLKAMEEEVVSIKDRKK